MRINTNVASLAAQESATNTNNTQTSALEKLGTGFAINKAADNASGLSIADKLRTQASSINQGLANGSSASALIQIADKAMGEQSNILDTVKTKLIQAATDTTNADGREAIRKDVNKLLEQFDNIASQTNYNGTTLLQKSETDNSAADELSFQLGEDKTFDINLKATKASNTSALGGGSDTVLSGAVGATVGGDATQGTTSTTAGNNIGVASSQQVNVTGSIQLQTVDVGSAGTEIDSTAIAMDIDVSGEIGNMIAAAEAATIDVSSQSTDIQTAVKALADNSTALTYDTVNDVFVLGADQSIDFGDLDFSAVNIKQDMAAGDSTVSLNATTGESTTLVISDNNTGTDNPLLGQINMLMESGDATGGNTLEDIKDLKEGELTRDKANEFMKTIDEAITQLNVNRSDFGSTQNQLESSMRNMQTTHTNLKAAESVIRDVNYAEESANFNKQNIIAQAGAYAMSQANTMAQSVSKLLQ